MENLIEFEEARDFEKRENAYEYELYKKQEDNRLIMSGLCRQNLPICIDCASKIGYSLDVGSIHFIKTTCFLCAKNKWSTKARNFNKQICS